ncbi:MAG: hypothetical protein ABIR79_05840 [Candidatus Binatia bacterium]
MRPFELTASRPLIASILALVLAVFLGDFVTPLGIVWVFYLAPIMPSAALRDAPDARALTSAEMVEALAALPSRSAPHVARDA